VEKGGTFNECDAQIPYIIENLSSPNEVRGNNRLKAVIEDTLIIIGRAEILYQRTLHLYQKSAIIKTEQLMVIWQILLCDFRYEGEE